MEDHKPKHCNGYTDNKGSDKFNPPLEISATNFSSTPETCEEMVNTYGTYEIQATADSGNDFPAIAQGTNDYMKKRSLDFYRDGDDPNPAADTSDKNCL